MVLSFYFIALLLGTLFAVIYLLSGNGQNQYKSINLLVLLILITGLLTETIWNYTRSAGMENCLLYNILYIYLRPSVMLLLYSQLPYSCELQKKILPSMAAFLGSGLIISLFFQSIFTNIQSYSYLIGHGLVLFYSLIFFKDILKQSQFRETNLLSIPYFWIATLVLFSFGEGYIFFILTYYFPSLGDYGMGPVFQWVQFFSGLMYLSFGLSLYAPMVFKRRYSY
ncbi:hypothetical protein SAMN04488057_101143 [Cyclobacterium lianum]|uniref:Uncharacterized protein n=1 Tax=Cyclobacterium lianum TaxID=388280 RepID=A0A1M7I1A3_9BACT|nr:hypothetical protein [Cyclobacterium lianum]SHM34419.1 hypothetical protein SAMN04488057_101143 [Cyclobacterium lianum]